jgi:hypothetical protein
MRGVDLTSPSLLTKDAPMTSPTEDARPKRPFYERALLFLVVGTFSLLLLYVKALAAILRLGIAAVRKIPGGGRREE